VQRLARIAAILLILSGVALTTAGVNLASNDVNTTAIVKFEGTIQARPAEKVGTWTIEGQAVQVVESTMVFVDQGAASVGAWVTVIANKMGDGSLEALIIRVQGKAAAEIEVHVAGYVSEVGANHLVLNGQHITYDQETVIEGTLKAGVFVAARIRVTPSMRKALHIRVVDWHEGCARKIIGRLEEIVGDKWIIDGHEIVVDATTIIHGDIQIGAMVSVKLTCDGDPMLAIEIELVKPIVAPEKVQIHGIIGRYASLLIGEWVVDGQSVWVTPMTKIEGHPEVGRMAFVEARRMVMGKLLATRIVIEGGEPELEQFTGTIHAFPPTHVGVWKVGTRWVMVLASTEIVGTPVRGAEARVTGRVYRGGDMFVATRIEVIPGTAPETPLPPVPPPPVTPDPSETPQARLHMMGFITEVGSSYIIVNGKTIKYNEQTNIEGDLVVGRFALVMALITSDGYIATDIAIVESIRPSGDGADAARALQRAAPALPQR
jgi:hypothetical protein